MNRVKRKQCQVCTTLAGEQVVAAPIRVGLPEATLIRFQSGKAGLGRNSAFTLQGGREGLQLHHDPEWENRPAGDVEQKMTFDL